MDVLQSDLAVALVGRGLSANAAQILSKATMSGKYLRRPEIQFSRPLLILSSRDGLELPHQAYSLH